MKYSKRSKSLILSILLSLVFNLEWTVPAWILLALHFFLDISVWWFVGSMILWVAFVLLRVFVFGSLTQAGNYKDPPKENKNPYSKKGDMNKQI